MANKRSAEPPVKHPPLPANPPFNLMLNIVRFRREVAALSTAECGALLLLKMHFWECGQIPNRDDALARITGMDPKAWKQARKALEPLFMVQHGVWRRFDWEEELRDAYEAIRKAKEKSQKGHDARWKRNAPGNASSNATGTAQGTASGMLNNKESVPPPGQRSNSFDSDEKFEQCGRAERGAA